MNIRFLSKVAAFLEQAFRVIFSIGFFGFWSLYAFVMATDYKAPYISTFVGLATLAILWLTIRQGTRWIGMMAMAVVTVFLFSVFMFGGYITNWLNPQVNGVSGLTLLAAITFFQRAWQLRAKRRKAPKVAAPTLTP